jgi:hypothetical protein
MFSLSVFKGRQCPDKTLLSLPQVGYILGFKGVPMRIHTIQLFSPYAVVGGDAKWCERVRVRL